MREVNWFRFGLSARKTAFSAWTALLDARVPRRLKFIALAAVLFVISPLNLLGDIPLLGIVDDSALLGLVLVWFTRASLPYTNTLNGGPIARP